MHQIQPRTSRFGPVEFVEIFLISLVLLIGGCSFISYNIASISEDVGETVQVGIQETQTTTRTGIEWGARVQIEEIKADTTKKTDFTFLLFYVTRFFIWVAVIALVGAGGLYLYRKASKS